MYERRATELFGCLIVGFCHSGARSYTDLHTGGTERGDNLKSRIDRLGMGWILGWDAGVRALALSPETCRGKRRWGKGSYAEEYLSPRHRDNPGDGCTMPALAQEVARSTPELKAKFERGLEEYLSADGGDRNEAIFESAAMIGDGALCGTRDCQTRFLGVSERSSVDLVFLRHAERVECGTPFS